MQHPNIRGKDPSEWVIDDRPTRCPYLPSETAHLPLRLPSRPLNRKELSQRLNVGDRRQGLLLYRPACPDCHACEAIRIDALGFQPTKTQRRVFRRGEASLQTRIALPTTSHEKVALYNRHKIERGLLIGPELLDPFGYEQFLVESCTETIELSFYDHDTLVAVTVVDRAEDALSAVYSYFEPTCARLSPGSFSILKLLSLCQEWELRYLYLGLYVTGCKAMEYKAGYFPHERLIDANWRRFERQEP